MNLCKDTIGRQRTGALALLWLGGLTVACASESPLGAVGQTDSTQHSEAGAAAGESSPDSDTVLSRALGGGDMQALRVVELFKSPADMVCFGLTCNAGIPTDLAFNPVRPDELWAVFRPHYEGQLCNETGDKSGCPLLAAAVAIISAADQASPTVSVLQDGNSWHFMRRVTALAFAQDGAFATVGEDRTGNFHDSPVNYMGPTLWSSDPDIFAIDFGRNGSHLDMLHATPYGMGIAHRTDHIFFAFNGQIGSIDAYDFHASHEPGGEDHSDGELFRYVEGAVKRSEDIPSHMEFMADRRTLLIADTGNQRVVALDVDSGRLAERIETEDSQIADPRRVADATLTVLIPPGVLEAPSGLVVGPDSFAVGDAETGDIHEFSFDGQPLAVLQTGFDKGALGGLELGPDDNLYVTRKSDGTVLRLERRER